MVLLIGAAPYRLDEHAASRLVEWIRQLAPDDAMGRAIQQLADEIGAEPTEPIELGDIVIEGLSAYVMRDYLVRGHEEMTALYFAIRRYRGDPII